jgi:hypothetical protein
LNHFDLVGWTQWAWCSGWTCYPRRPIFSLTVLLQFFGSSSVLPISSLDVFVFKIILKYFYFYFFILCHVSTSHRLTRGISLNIGQKNRRRYQVRLFFKIQVLSVIRIETYVPKNKVVKTHILKEYLALKNKIITPRVERRDRL